MTGTAAGRDRILDRLDDLAAVEHALCVEYLSIHCALGRDEPAADDGRPPSGCTTRPRRRSDLALREQLLDHRAHRRGRDREAPMETARASGGCRRR
jgi:hypothetical protein